MGNDIIFIYKFWIYSRSFTLVKSALSLASSNVISSSVELEGKTLSETSSCVLSLEFPSCEELSPVGPSCGVLSLGVSTSAILSLEVLSLDALSLPYILK